MNFRPLLGMNTKANIMKLLLVVKLYVITKEGIYKSQG